MCFLGILPGKIEVSLCRNKIKRNKSITDCNYNFKDSPVNYDSDNSKLSISAYH